MKKISYILLSVFIFSLVIFSGILMSCELTENKPEAEIKAPGVTLIENGKGIAITAYNVSDVKYVNFYRQDVTDNENPGPVVNIGILFPEYYSAHGWLYQDYYVYAANKYKYSVRYVTKDGTYKSGWSRTIEAQSDYLSEADLFKYTIPEVTYFEFAGSPNYTIKIKGADISAKDIPVEFFDEHKDNVKPKIIFSNGTTKKAYPIESLSENTELSLRTFLEPDFLNTEISLVGIVFEKLVYTSPDPPIGTEPQEEPKIRCVIWGELNAGDVVVKQEGNGQIETFLVRSTDDEPGYDYSDYGSTAAEVED